MNNWLVFRDHVVGKVVIFSRISQCEAMLFVRGDIEAKTGQGSSKFTSLISQSQGIGIE